MKRKRIPVLNAAVSKLSDDTDPYYWKSTEGNARRALMDLAAIAAQAVVEGKGAAKWNGD